MNVVHFLSKKITDYNGKIPFIVSELIQKLREVNAKQVEGIFRLSASMVALNDILSKLDRGQTSCLTNVKDSILLSCALKAYFRELSEFDPLITLELSESLVKLIDTSEEEKCFQEIQNQIFKMESERIYTIGYLLLYLHEVGENSENNKMNYGNIAICFAPNILAFRSGNEQANALASNNICKFLIREAKNIFGHLNFTDDLFLSQLDVFLLTCSNYDLKTVEFIKRRWMARTNSYIPFTPIDWFEDPNFKRPTRKYYLPGENEN